MILPTKHTKVENSLLGIGASLLEELRSPATVSSFWEKTKSYSGVKTFERFTLTLSFLNCLGLVEFHNGMLKKADHDN